MCFLLKPKNHRNREIIILQNLKIIKELNFNLKNREQFLWITITERPQKLVKNLMEATKTKVQENNYIQAKILTVTLMMIGIIIFVLMFFYDTSE